MKYYKTKSNWLEAKIYEVEAERVTDSSIWIDGRANRIKSNYECYFETYQEAYDFLISKSQTSVDRKQVELDSAKKLHEKILKLNP